MGQPILKVLPYIDSRSPFTPEEKLMSSPLLAALVTGGGRGIGCAISRRLAKDQAVLLVGREKGCLQKTVAEIAAQGGLADYLAVDISSEDAAARIGETLQQLHWTVSSLVLNASIGKSGATEKSASSDFSNTFSVNVFSALPLVQLVLPDMIARKAGTICFLSSILGLKGTSHDAAYVASKHAQIGFARALACEYGKYGISVVPICPSFVESEMTTRSINSLSQRKSLVREEARRIIEKLTPQRRIIPAEEVARVVAFVCSGAAPSLSGNPLILGGGAL